MIEPSKNKIAIERKEFQNEYIGFFYMDQYHGKGKLRTEKGDIYEG